MIFAWRSGRVLHVLHLFEQAVVLRVVVIRGVLAVMPHLLVRPIQQEQKIFRIGVIAFQPKIKHLRVAFAHLVLKAVVVGGATT